VQEDFEEIYAVNNKFKKLAEWFKTNK